MRNILIVDDESSILDFLSAFLEKCEYKVDAFLDPEKAIESFKNKNYDAVISDVKMPKITGLELLKKVKTINPAIVVILITAHGSADSAVEAMKFGAEDYVSKPFKLEEIKLILNRALERASEQSRGIQTIDNDSLKSDFSKIIGESESIKKVKKLIEQVASTKSNVLITGESGTGKELIARAIHTNSGNQNKKFIALNCSALPENLLESELFGHKKGSFTGAVNEKIGLFQAAEGGTIFLDEIGDMPISLQVKLLRALQDRKVRPVGDTNDIEFDARILSATNKDLEEEMKSARFREDLFYRLNVIQISSPPLRERRSDIEILSKHFMNKFSREMKKDIHEIDINAMNILKSYSYPGNIRELENIIERAIALENGKTIIDESLPSKLRSAVPITPSPEDNEIFKVKLTPGFNLDDLVGDLEKAYLLKALENSNGVKTKAADILGITFRSMRYRCKKYGISLDE